MATIRKEMTFKKLVNQELKRKALLQLSIFFFIWIIFEDKLLEIFEATIFPLLSIIKFNAISTCLFLIIIFLLLVKFCKCLKNRYNISFELFVILSFIVYVYVKYRCFGNYISLPPLFFNLGYTDIAIILIFLFISSYLYSFLYSFFHNTLSYFYPFRKYNDELIFISDEPITNPELDELDYSESAKVLAKSMETMQLSSIGLIAPWGTGKSSYLNLLEHYSDKNKFIFIKFNPRHSRSAINIQENFFDALFSELSKYDIRFSSTFKKYLRAIDIINDNKIISFILNANRIWDKKAEKDKISDAILRLNKKVVVIIEDLDRLMSEEIIEIFKLIDGNASFSNLIFITAYDKEQINKIIGEAYSNDQTSFSDKFFNVEIQIPLRPYSKIYSYFETQLLRGIDVVDQDKYKSALSFNLDLLKKYITTLRDAKRFFNLFIGEYLKAKEEVEFRDYLLLYLIKYRYLDEYSQLYKGVFNSNISLNQIFLDESFLDASSKIRSKDVLNILFSKESFPKLRSINNPMAFDFYFHNSVSGHLKMAEMEELFEDNIDYKEIINSFVMQNTVQDISPFLDSKNILVLGTQKRLERYLDIWIYLYANSIETTISYFKILSIIDQEYSKSIKDKYEYSDERYHDLITNKLQGKYPCYPYLFIRLIVIGLINKDLKEKIIFSKEDILNIANNALDDLIRSNKSIEQLHLDLLYSCISDIDQKTRNVKLDEGACTKIRNLIQEKPAKYFSNFVRLGMISSSKESNSVTCEPFWPQIFNDSTYFEAFIRKQDEASVPNITLINNFWELYKNNGYKPIEFEFQGNVQKKIDNELKDEVKELGKLLDIEEKFKKLENNRLNPPVGSGHDSQFYLDNYKLLLEGINKINLLILKRGKLVGEIKSIVDRLVMIVSKDSSRKERFPR